MQPKATVLIIEDSLYLAESLIDMLEMHNYRPVHARTGKEGLEQAFSLQPDLILLDIRLPDISGYEVYRQIRGTTWGATARIMILTASESYDHIAVNISLAPEDVLFKPEWSMQQLIARIEAKIQTPTS